MTDRPEPEALLAEARHSLLESLVPALPEAKRYEALMIANALGIVGRELAAGEQPENEARAELSALMGDAGASTQDLRARLAAGLRAGRHDAAEAVHRALLDDAVRRVRISNPKRLKALGLD